MNTLLTESKQEIMEVIKQLNEATKLANNALEGLEKLEGSIKTTLTRKEVIEKAKKFVDGLPNTVFVPVGKGYVNSETKFIVDPKERTVTALFTDTISGVAVYKTVAKCSLEDVFNIDIGMAIAWGKAIDKHVSELENAPQPTEIKRGMVIDIMGITGDVYESDFTVEAYDELSDVVVGNDTKGNKSRFIRNIKQHGFKIKDDSNVVY